MRIPPGFITGLLLIVSVCSLVSASSVMIIAYEQTDKTALIPEAIIYADGVIKGKTDLNGEYNLSYEGDPPIIRLVKGGYTDWTGSPSVNDTALLVPMDVRNSSLNVEIYDADTATPVQNSQISIMGEDGSEYDGRTGPDGRSIISLKPDQVYNIRIQTRDFQPVNDTIVTNIDNTTVQYSLVRNDRISIRTTDSNTNRPIPNVNVQIDGNLAGITNERGILVTNTSRNQEHIFNLDAVNYEPVRQARIVTDQDKLIEFSLTEGKGTVFVSVYDEENRPISGADIQVDGVSFGKTNEYGRLMVPGLEMRMHEFSAGMDGFKEASLSKIPGSDMGEVILVLSKEYKDLLVTVRDKKGSPLSNSNVSVYGNEEQKKNSYVTDSKGIANFSVEKNTFITIAVEKEGYYSNTTTIQPEYDNITLILNPKEKEKISTSPVFPLLPVFVVTILILIVIGAVVVLKKRQGSQRKRRVPKRRSL